jgi:hypothetical protein
MFSVLLAMLVLHLAGGKVLPLARDLCSNAADIHVHVDYLVVADMFFDMLI